MKNYCAFLSLSLFFLNVSAINELGSPALQAFFQKIFSERQLAKFEEYKESDATILKDLLKGKYSSVKIQVTPETTLDNSETLLSFILKNDCKPAFFKCVKYNPQAVVDYIKKITKEGGQVHEKYRKNFTIHEGANLTAKFLYNLAMNIPISQEECLYFLNDKIKKYKNRWRKKSVPDDHEYFLKKLEIVDNILTQADLPTAVHFFNIDLFELPEQERKLLLQLFAAHGFNIQHHFSEMLPHYKKYFYSERNKKNIKPRLGWLLTHQAILSKRFIEQSSMLNSLGLKGLKRAHRILSAGGQASLLCCDYNSEKIQESIQQSGSSLAQYIVYKQVLEPNIPNTNDLFSPVLLPKKAYDVYTDTYNNTCTEYLEEGAKQDLLNFAQKIYGALITKLCEYNETPPNIFDFSTFEEFCDVCKTALNLLVVKKAEKVWKELSEEQKEIFTDAKIVESLVCSFLKSPLSETVPTTDTFLKNLIENDTFKTRDGIERFLKNTKSHEDTVNFSSMPLIGF